MRSLWQQFPQFLWRRSVQSATMTSPLPALDFREMPTPRRLPLVGTTLALIAAGAAPRLHEYVDRRHLELGPVYRESIGPVDAVFVADPADMRQVFNREGRYPKHVLPEAWIVYNQMFGCSRGLFFMDDDEWLHFRRIMNKLLLKSDSMQWLQEPCEEVASAIVTRWQTLLTSSNSNSTVISNLEEQLYRFSIDTMIAVLLGDKYSECNAALETDVAYLASVVHMIFQTSAKLQLISAKWAARFKLPVWNKFVAAADDGLDIAFKLTKKIMQECPKGNGLVSKMMEENVNEKDIARIVADLILAAGDTTAYSMQWTIYLLAKHVDAQEKLVKNLENDTNFSNYMKGILRESLRLYPVAPFLTRILPQNTSIGGYAVPTGTLVIMSLYSSSRSPKFFTFPEKFWPERWLRNGVKEFTAASSNASLPFAMGARSCIGRKIAETQMQVALKEIISKFSIELIDDKEVEMILRMVSVPSTPISVKITARN